MTGGSCNALNRRKPSARQASREVHGSCGHDDPSYPARSPRRLGAASRCDFGCRPLDGLERGLAVSARLLRRPPQVLHRRCPCGPPGRGGHHLPVTATAQDRVQSPSEAAQPRTCPVNESEPAAVAAYRAWGGPKSMHWHTETATCRPAP